METDTVNSLDNVALDLQQTGILADALAEYDAPDMYWGDNSRPEDFRRQCADEIRSRLHRKIQQEGIRGIAIALSEEEYRVVIEALVQYKQSGAETTSISDVISHVQWFAGDA